MYPAIMDSAKLEPWMLLSDWREDERLWLWIDLATWPLDLRPDPLPPVPVIGVGPPGHPQAHRVDALIEPGFSLDRIARNIKAFPQAAATTIQLLRALEGARPADALTAESFAFAMLQQGPEHLGWRTARTREATRAASPAPPVTVSRADEQLHIVLSRPETHNVIDRAMRDALFDAFMLAAVDQTITAVHVRADGRTFSMGAELDEFGTTPAGIEAHQIRARTLPAWPMIRRPDIYHFHIGGGCVGAGLELAAFAHGMTASPKAWFQLPELSMGLLPGFGGCVSVPQRIGRQRTALLVLSGRRIDARTASAWGLVDAITGDTRSTRPG